MQNTVKFVMVILLLAVVMTGYGSSAENLTATDNYDLGWLDKVDGFHRPFSATGTVFVLKDNPISPDLKITSSEEIHIFIEAITNTISFHIEPLSTTKKKETVITIWGLEYFYPNPNNKSLTLYKHQDGYFQKEFKLNKKDKYTYTQDISKRHHIYILPRAATVNIWGRDDFRDEVVSKDIGIWLDATTCQLTKNISDDIIIQANNLTLDGNGYIISGPGYGYGIYLNERTVVIVKNCTVQNFNDGIYLSGSSNNILTDNTIVLNTSTGINLYPYSSGNILTNNSAISNYRGIFIAYSSGNELNRNNVNSNTYAGIDLQSNSNITLINNTINGPSQYFGIYSVYNSYITLTNNTINGDYYGIYMYSSSFNNTIYHNDIYSNALNVYSDQPIELSYFNPVTLRNEGNWWGRTQLPGFVGGIDSNAPVVVDSYPYLVQDGWLKGYAPGQPEILPDTTPPTGTILINNDNPYTDNVLVNLTLAAQDPESGVSWMRFSNDGLTWSLWEPYITAKQWTLTTGDGLKTVYVEYKNGAGLTTISSDTIILDTTPPTGSILINNDNPYTNNVLINLTLSAQDPESGVSLMHFSNDGLSWSLWEPYITAKQWTLTTDDGLKTVYVEYKNGAGLTAVFSDTIILQTLPPPIIPNAPSNLVAVAASASQINLTWQDNADNELGFKIERKTTWYGTYEQIATVNTDVTTYSDSGLLFRTLYFYRVKTYNQAGESGYSNEAPAITFAKPVPSISWITTLLDRCYVNGLIKNQGIYTSLLSKLNNAQKSIQGGNITDAIGQLNALINEIKAQKGKGIDPLAAKHLHWDSKDLLDYLSAKNSLPTTLELYLATDGRKNDVVIILPDGEIVTTKLAGYITVRLEPTSNPDIASFRILKSEYIGTSFKVKGVDFGRVYVNIDDNNPGEGTFNMKTGEVEVIERVTITSAYMKALGIPPIPFEFPSKGVASPLKIVGGGVEFIGLGTLPENIPLIGGGKIIACYVNIPFIGEFASCVGETMMRIVDTEEDDQGNKIHTCVSPNTFRIKFEYATGKTVWIAACKYGNATNTIEKGGDNANKNGKKDKFTYVDYENNEDNDQNNDGKPDNTTRYIFASTPAPGAVTIIKLKDGEPVGPPEVKDPAPEKVEDLDPPLTETAIGPYCIQHPCCYFLLDRYDAQNWEYYLYIYEDWPLHITAGDTITLAGEGITSAIVSGKAATAHYGAWQVKEVSSTYVIFEATKRAVIDEPLYGFTISSSNAIPGFVNWCTVGDGIGYQGSAVGPARTRD